MQTLQERLFSKVNKTSNCWNWLGSLAGGGYGQIRCFGKLTYVHRVSWSIRNGKIPNNLYVLHKCDNRRCVNPDHLFLGSKLDNARDMVLKRRQAIGENNGRSKLSDVEAKRMVKEYIGGNVTQRELCHKYGVQHATVSYRLKKYKQQKGDIYE